LRETWDDAARSESSDWDRKLGLLRDRSLESREGFGDLSSAEFAELLLAIKPFEDPSSSVERLLYSEKAKVLCDASNGLEPRKRLTVLLCSEIKGTSDVFGGNPNDRAPGNFSGKGDFGGGVGCDM
jgi:hypothetical protein